MSHIFPYFMALSVGTLVIFQAGINSKISQRFGSPFHGVLVNFIGGLILILFIFWLNKIRMPSRSELISTPFYLYFGGIIGVLFVGGSLYFAPKIGGANWIAFVVAGQLLGALIVDQLGLLGFVQQPISFTKILGSLLIISGAYIINK